MRQTIIVLTYIVFTLLNGCKSVSTSKNASSLNFSKILSFQIGSTTQSDIASVLGEPSSISQKSDYFIITYNDSETGFQRFSANINKNDNKLLSLLWLPKDNELESDLNYAKKSFSNTHYIENKEENLPSHMVSADIVLYVDQKAGVTIRYDKRRNEVEAIAVYDLKKRTPSSIK